MKKIFFIILILCNYYYQEFDVVDSNELNRTDISQKKVNTKKEYVNKYEIGYLKVNGTKINYKVLKYKDNKYYLKHNYENKYSNSGAIFIDYRNNINKLDKNTIIYGHSMLNGTMFGSLKNVLKKEWLLNKNNHIIEFNIKDKKMYWKVFSVYTTKNETYYLNTNTDKLFIYVIKARSIYDFNTQVNENDYILTLSTCYKNNKRLVVHAKKIRDY